MMNLSVRLGSTVARIYIKPDDAACSPGKARRHHVTLLSASSLSCHLPCDIDATGAQAFKRSARLPNQLAADSGESATGREDC